MLPNRILMVAERFKLWKRYFRAASILASDARPNRSNRRSRCGVGRIFATTMIF
jgi:hypothetical protein